MTWNSIVNASGKVFVLMNSPFDDIYFKEVWHLEVQADEWKFWKVDKDGKRRIRNVRLTSFLKRLLGVGRGLKSPIMDYLEKKFGWLDSIIIDDGDDIPYVLDIAPIGGIS
jgi:hypothetical protein